MSGPREVLIVGGGVVGLCCAWYARQAGHGVTVVERGGPDRDGCSYGNAGLINPSHFIPLAAPGMVGLGLRWMVNPESPFYIRPRLDRDLLVWGWRFWRACRREQVDRAAPLLRDLALASRAEFLHWQKEWREDFSLAHRGCTMLCRTEAGLTAETAVAVRARTLGVSAEVWSAGELAERKPGLRMNVAGGVHFPQDSHLDPARFMAVLKRRLQAAEVRFVWEAEVTGWESREPRLTALLTNRGRFTGDEVVLAAGAWSGRLMRGLGLRLPLQAGKGYSLTLDKPPVLPSTPMILTEARVAVTPLGGRLRFAGTMELAGLDESVQARRLRGIAKSVAAWLPDFEVDPLLAQPAWCGLRPVSPDGLPYVGRVPRWSNLIVATGHAMLGVSLAPITGRLVAELLSGSSPSIPLALLRPDRYA